MKRITENPERKNKAEDMCMSCQTAFGRQIACRISFLAKSIAQFYTTMRPNPTSETHLFRFLTKVVLFVALITGVGCGSTPGDYGRFEVAPTGEELKVQSPWKLILSQSDLPASSEEDPVLKALLEDILQLGQWPPSNPESKAALDTAWQAFVRFEGTQMAVRGIDSVLNQTGQLQGATQTLSDAFLRWPAHFPETPAPHLALTYTGYNYSVYPTDEWLMVGCEFFIGQDHPAVQGLPTSIYPRYMQERMVPEHLAADALRGWLLVHFQQDHYDRQSRLADELLYWGKVLYVARCLAPDIAPHDMMDWTQEEWNWAQDHERQVWSELRVEEQLYSSKRIDIQRWVVDGPFTNAGQIPQDSPDRLGWYVGLRWVEDWVSRQKDLSLKDLMAKKDVLPFLQAYRPGS